MTQVKYQHGTNLEER